jgi:hypothetical protein
VSRAVEKAKSQPTVIREGGPGMVISIASPAETANSRLLTDHHRALFDVQGFISLNSLFTIGDIAIVRTLLDDLFVHRNMEHGLIDKALQLDPRLRQTRVYHVCHAVARELSGQFATCSFDKAIYKAPYDPKGTLWHQDQAGPGKFSPMNTIHFWIPLQAVTADTGCMRYESGSHLRGLLPHHRYDPNDPYTLITEDILTDQIIDCPLDLGGMLIHRPLTLHAAFPNQSPQVRRVWALLFRPLGRYGFLAPSRILQQFTLLRQHWSRRQHTD